jgi:hypothetical protein
MSTVAQATQRLEFKHYRTEESDSIWLFATTFPKGIFHIRHTALFNLTDIKYFVDQCLMSFHPRKRAASK